jgi:uncharacterized phage infection (PIP) family protein YhgE
MKKLLPNMERIVDDLMVRSNELKEMGEIVNKLDKIKKNSELLVDQLNNTVNNMDDFIKESRSDLDKIKKNIDDGVKKLFFVSIAILILVIMCVIKLIF